MTAATLKAIAESARDAAYADCIAVLQKQAHWHDTHRDPEHAAGLRYAAQIMSRHISLSPLDVEAAPRELAAKEN